MKGIRVSIRFVCCVLSGLFAATEGFAQQDREFAGAAIITTERFEYGRYEVRMKSARGSGIVSAFFMRSSRNTPDGTLIHELDFEFMGKSDRLLHLAYHEGIDNPSRGLRRNKGVKNLNLTFSPAADFHNYALEFTPEGIVWFAEGKEIWRLGNEVAERFRNVPMVITCNIWCPRAKGWAGTVTPDELPVSSEIDSIAFSKWRAADGTFVEEWSENFDTLSASRWNKANWTWGGNLAFMKPENAAARDGRAVLSVTRNDR